MKHVTVVSGKGGTGKTTLTAFWGSLLADHVMVDADVDAANLPLVFRHTDEPDNAYFGADRAVVDQELCAHCGTCADACRFDAFRVTIGDDGTSYYTVDPLACEGCTLCTLVCPLEGITMQAHESGTWCIAETDYAPMVHASLSVGEGNSGKLVTEVRRAAEGIAIEQGRDLILIDGPPGIGCQTTAAINGVDLVVVVTEPTLSGIHDMERLLEVINRMGIPAVVVLNKADLAPQHEQTARNAAAKHGAELIGSVPFIEDFPRAMAMGTLLTRPPEGVPERMRAIWAEVVSRIPEQVY
jgi:MinD superfamily P-loop ATPase